MTSAAPITGYHAHIYYDADTKPAAKRLRARLEEAFSAPVYGRWHDRPVGPHPRWSYQVTFAPEQRDEIVAFIDAHREGLTVLLHEQTGNALRDHTDGASFLGEAVALDLA
ncbi:MAG: DOPA 4,5-dioxygenase family protein, partial [Alphaproteobacteria bacterium]